MSRGFLPYLFSGSLISVTPALHMASDYTARLATAKAAAALQQRVTNKMAALHAAEKKAAEARARVRSIALLLEEQQASATTLEAEAMAVALQVAPTTASSSTPPPPSSGGDGAIIALLDMQAYGIQNIRSLVSTILDPSSIGYAR
jgi:hypothetical protein